MSGVRVWIDEGGEDDDDADAFWDDRVATKHHYVSGDNPFRMKPGTWHPQAEADARDAVVEAARQIGLLPAPWAVLSVELLWALDRLAETERGDG